MSDYKKQLEEELIRLLPHKDTLFFEIGKILRIASKEMQTDFMPWAKKATGLSSTTINTYIKVYTLFNSRQTQFQHLSFWILHELSFFPDYFVEKVAMGEIIPSLGELRRLRSYILGSKTPIEASDLIDKIASLRKTARIQKSSQSIVVQETNPVLPQITENIPLSLVNAVYGVPADVQIEIGNLRKTIEKLSEDYKKLEKEKEDACRLAIETIGEKESINNTYEKERKAAANHKNVIYRLEKTIEELRAHIKIVEKERDGNIVWGKYFMQLSECVNKFEKEYNYIKKMSVAIDSPGD